MCLSLAPNTAGAIFGLATRARITAIRTYAGGTARRFANFRQLPALSAVTQALCNSTVLMRLQAARTMPLEPRDFRGSPDLEPKDAAKMKSMQKPQQGLSGIGVIILLAIIGAGTYIGLQYIPQYIEAGTVDSILSNLEKAQEETPFSSTNAVRDMINKQLTLNQMDDLRDSFKITQDGEAYIVEVSFMRDLNLIYKKQPMPYEQTLTLR
jgi:hypothetical protein